MAAPSSGAATTPLDTLVSEYGPLAGTTSFRLESWTKAHSTQLLYGGERRNPPTASNWVRTGELPVLEELRQEGRDRLFRSCTTVRQAGMPSARWTASCRAGRRMRPGGFHATRNWRRCRRLVPRARPCHQVDVAGARRPVARSRSISGRDAGRRARRAAMSRGAVERAECGHLVL